MYNKTDYNKYRILKKDWKLIAKDYKIIQHKYYSYCWYSSNLEFGTIKSWSF